jgi:hypothetical protein
MSRRHPAIEIGRVIDAGWDAARTERALVSVHRAVRRRRAIALGSIAAAAVAAIGVLSLRPAQPPPLAMSVSPSSSTTETSGATRSATGREEGASLALEVATAGPAIAGASGAGVVDGDLAVGALYAGASEGAPIAPTTTDSAPPSDALERPARPMRSHRTVSAASEWSRLARRGEYEAAYLELERAGAEVPDRVESLLLAADAARLSGHPVEALPWLERVIGEHPDDARSALAAFTAGRVLMQLGRPREAAARFERALELEPSGSLRGDALARAAEAHARAGAATRATALARRYEIELPGGRWEARMRSLARAEQSAASPED